MPSTGWGSVTTPGAVSLWMTLHARYGKLPFADLFEPAIKYAHDGFRVSYMVARQWARAVDRLRGQQDWVRDFMPNGRTPQTGELWKFPDQAKTLTKIAESGGEAFYRGELADAMDSHARATGGGLRLQRPRRAQGRLGRSDRPHLSRRDAARDPAVGPGHRRLHGARHPRELRRRRPRRRRAGGGASQDRGDEARLRRHLALRRRSALHGRHAGADARQALPQEPRQADRPEEGQGVRPGPSRRTAARSISAPPTLRA